MLVKLVTFFLTKENGSQIAMYRNWKKATELNRLCRETVPSVPLVTYLNSQNNKINPQQSTELRR